MTSHLFRRSGMPAAAIWIPAALLGGAALVPVVYLAIRATEDPTGAVRVLATSATLLLLFRSLLFAAVVTLMAATMAVPLAWLTTRTDLPARRAIAFLAPLPLAIPSYVAALAAIAAFSPRGMLQGLLAPLGVEQLPSIYGFGGAAIVLALVTYPYLYLTLRPAMLALDPRLEELSRTFGYGTATTFRRIVVPQLRPALASGGLLVALYALSDFGTPSLMRFDSFTRVIFNRYQSSFERGEAAGLALVLGALALSVVALEVWSRGRGRQDSAHGQQRVTMRIALGRWRWPAFAFVATVLGFALVLPVGTLLYWLLRAIDAPDLLYVMGASIRGSATAGLLASLAATAAALPFALLTVRYPRWWLTRPLEVLSYTGYALPGLVVALALVFTSVRFGTLYQSLGVLIAAYVMLFLPQAIGATRVGLVQVRPSMEEAARGMGRAPLQVIRSITLPLARRGVLAGAALVFLSTMKELPVTLLLSPTGYRTLASRVWGLSNEGLYAQAAIPALLLIALSSIPVLAASMSMRHD